MARTNPDNACAQARPTRTCVGCRERAAKQDLLRVVAGDRGEGPVLLPDPRGTMPGRGAHLHPTSECFELALRRRAFPRALRVAGGIDPEPVREHLQAQHSTTS